MRILVSVRRKGKSDESLFHSHIQKKTKKDCCIVLLFVARLSIVNDCESVCRVAENELLLDDLCVDANRFGFLLCALNKSTKVEEKRNKQAIFNFTAVFFCVI